MNRDARRQRLAAVRLLHFSDRIRIRASLPEWFRPLWEAGLDGAVLRERDLVERAYEDIAATLQRDAERSGRLLIATNRLAVCRRLELPGVHLGSDGPSVRDAREVLGPGALIGASIHSPGEIESPRVREADYFVLAPVFETGSKPGRQALGVEALAEACRRTEAPVYALGGLDAETIPAALAGGAHGVAVLGALTDVNDPAGAVRRLRSVC